MQAMLGRSLDPGEPLSIRGVLSQAHAERDRLAGSFAEVNGAIRDKLLELRSDPDYVKRARHTVPDSVRPRLFVVLGELARDKILDRASPITANDASDYIHAAIPSLACDFLLLDGAWRHRVEGMRRRMLQSGVDIPLAKCFSKSDDGLGRFLDALETWD